MAGYIQISPKTRKGKGEGVEFTGLRFEADDPAGMSELMELPDAIKAMKPHVDSKTRVAIWGASAEKRHPTTSKQFRQTIADGLGLPLHKVSFIHKRG